MTGVIALALTLMVSGNADATFDARMELQGIYDEISQANLQFATQADIELFHDVFYTSDWMFVDDKGVPHPWPEVRTAAVRALDNPPADSMIQPIQTLSLTPGGATATVRATVVHTIVDADGKYGKTGATHTLTETTMYRDTWVRMPNGWRLKSREQVGASTVAVDKLESLT